MIPADILDALWVALVIVGLGMMACGGLRLLEIAVALKRARLVEPETHGKRLTWVERIEQYHGVEPENGLIGGVPIHIWRREATKRARARTRKAGD